MATTTVNGVTIDYDVVGEGPPVIVTPGGWYSRASLSETSRGLSECCTVLTWDCRNTGNSGIAFEDRDHEFAIMAEDAFALIKQLGLAPCFAVGMSGGSFTTLQLAHMHPEVLLGIVLLWSGSHEIFPGIQEIMYKRPAELARREGMAAVVADKAWSSRAVSSRKPELAEYLRQMEPTVFAAAMDRWATYGRQHGLPAFGDLTQSEIEAIRLPALVIPGGDESHRKESGEELHSLLPQSTLWHAPQEVWERFHAAVATQGSTPDAWTVYETAAGRFYTDAVPQMKRFISEISGAERHDR